MATQTGTVLQGADGAKYFIRSEVLEACRVQPDEMEDLERMLAEQESEVSGFGLNTGPLVSVTPVSYSSPQHTAIHGETAMSTVMCCW
jgi:hypothetical protein